MRLYFNADHRGTMSGGLYLLIVLLLMSVSSELLSQTLSAHFRIVEPLDSVVLQKHNIIDEPTFESNLRAEMLRCFSDADGCTGTRTTPRLVVVESRELVASVSVSPLDSSVATVEWVFP